MMIVEMMVVMPLLLLLMMMMLMMTIARGQFLHHSFEVWRQAVHIEFALLRNLDEVPERCESAWCGTVEGWKCGLAFPVLGELI